MSLVGMIFGEPVDKTICHCYRGGKQHCFEPRYSTTANSANISDVQMQFIASTTYSEDMADAIKACHSENRTYVHDICVWCGEIRKPS